ncbi:MAG: efflux RND transporter periplasmic adaptor subunit, partial [Lachnospiraceae bacterium]|nr:efflux RND transporter periplasmic adaptor subunit [Lachnospiraceae bacterium]
MKNRQRKLVLLLCTILSTSALWGCGQTVEEKTADDIAIVETANPEVGELKLSANFIATINPDESVYVIPKATAEVLEVKVEAGDVVEEGDVLAVLDDTMAQFSVKSAQINLDNAQHAYNLQYGEGATTLNNMQADNTVSQAEDGVNKLQENLVDAMDNLQKTKDKLKEKEDELADLKEEYDFREDVDEIKDYADTFDKNTPQGAADYAAVMQRYQLAATEVKTVEGAITQYKSAIDQYEEAIETLQDNIDSTYDSYSQAVTSTNISNGELREEQKKTSQNNISAAKLGIEQAKESLEGYTITATISGVIESVNLKEHDFATSSSPAFVISNKSTMVATYYVSEDVRNTFSTGQKITLEKDNKLYDGEVIEIGGALDTATGLFKIKAAVKGNVSDLLSGTKATVTTDTYHEKNAVIIPYDSVYYDGSQAYVYTVVDGKAKRTDVMTGLYDIDKIVIQEGLTKDDTIITTWSAQLRDGVEVSTRENKSDNDN